MAFWLYMLAADLLLPLLMVLLGRRFRTHPPEEINGVYGYRTARSMKNRETWDFAHRYIGGLWVRLGLVLLPLSVLPLLFVLGRDANTVGLVGAAVCLVQLIPLLGSILPTERALARAFDENGRRRGE